MRGFNFLIGISFLLLSACTSSDTNDGKSDDLVKKSKQSNAFSSSGSTAITQGNSSNYTPAGKLIIKLTPFVPPYPDIGSSGKRLLSTRLNNAIAKVGFGGDGGNPRFIIGPDINLLSKNITSTAPTKFANTYEVTLLSADVETETIFASYSFEIKGVGDSPAKSFINGFRDFNLQNEDFYSFLSETQRKLIQYYDSNCGKIMLMAESEAKSRNFDKAFAILKSIPIEASKCFEMANNKKQDYFQQSLNQNCQPVLAKMKAELGKANDPSASGFNEAAMSYYSMIDQSSDCYEEAELIYQNYLRKLDSEGKRDWEFKMQQYRDKIDQIEKERQFKRDTALANFEYLKHKDEMQAQAEIQGNKKLLQKYQYDQLPWLRKIFHLGKYDPFDGIED